MLVFAGLARDCAGTLPGFFALLDALDAKGFATYSFVGENGSHDQTRALLAKQASKGRLSIVDTSAMASVPSRLGRMAVGRQRLLDEMKSSGFVARHVCVVDLDDPMRAPPSAETLMAACRRLDSVPGYFARAATSFPTYYDLLAFEDESRCYGATDFHALKLRRNPLAYYRFFRDFVYPEQARLTRASEIECRSAFNGLCVYRFADYVGGSYVEGSDFSLCEHLVFNRMLGARLGKTMVVDPLLKVAMPPEHGRRTLFGFWLQRVRKLAIARPAKRRPS